MLRLLRRTVLLAPTGLALLLALGFAWFMHLALQPTPPPPAADGIVALTGGADRVATALRLLSQGRGRILLVSGVGTATDFAALVRLSGADPALQNRVTLGHDAASTHGNALETRQWAQAHDVHSLVVVTAFYHMPRALAELAATLPGVPLHPVAVHPPLAQGQELRLLLSEYSKWLAFRLGLSRPLLVGQDLLAGAPVAGRRDGG